MTKPAVMHTISGFCHAQRPKCRSCSSSVMSAQPTSRNMARSKPPRRARAQTTRTPALAAAAARSAASSIEGRCCSLAPSLSRQEESQNITTAKPLPNAQPSTIEMNVCAANLQMTICGGLTSLSARGAICATRSCITANSITTTTSTTTVTASTMVVKGPLAWSSSMMAIAEEGERATARLANISATASCWSGPSSGRKGMK
mmetsp:Transcript_24212/g.56280  ORF Transcript_24212/g.56280 Transcript_24212/m.56280 type:complete len:203 (+) Transcript_24212:275-883(+)